MLFVKCAVKPSAIHGTGCFTTEPIKAGQLVWRFDERLDIRFPIKEIPNFPPSIQEYISFYGYQEIVDGEKVVTLCSDLGKFMNHSSTPNTVEVNGDNIAVEDIPAGTELTCDYYTFDLTVADRFGEKQHIGV